MRSVIRQIFSFDNVFALFIAMKEELSIRYNKLRPISKYLQNEFKRGGVFVSLEHARFLHEILFLTQLMKSSGVNCFLMCGTLLGAVRSGTFAGRPSDIDLGVTVDHWEQLKNIYDANLKEMYSWRVLNKNFPTVVEIRSKYTGVKISFLRFNRTDLPGYSYNFTKIYIDGSVAKNIYISKKDQIDREFFINGFKFIGPQYSEKILTDLYGDGWQVPFVRGSILQRIAKKIRL